MPVKESRTTRAASTIAPFSGIPTPVMDLDYPPDPLTHQELAELDDLLMQSTPDAMSIDTLEVFMTAAIINPEPVEPEQFMPWVWDAENGMSAPPDDAPAQLDRLIDLLMRFIGGLAVDLANNLDGFEPRFGLFNASEWCQGFLLGTRFHPNLWLPVTRHHPELFEPIVRLAEEDGEEGKVALQNLVSSCVLGLAIALNDVASS